MADKKFDLVVIGGGPGGYTGAIRAAQLGMKVALIEKRPHLGGTCLNVGCIPSKALLESSELYAAAKHDLAAHGIKLSQVELNLESMMGRKNKIVSDLQNGISFLMKKNKIEVFQGTGALKDKTHVEVQGKETLETRFVMLATGSVPVELPFMKFDGKMIVSSTEALEFKDVPKEIVIVGAGVIGLELGSVWLRLGSQVTAIEFFDHIGGAVDLGVSKELQKSLEKQGMKFLLQTKVTGAEVKGSRVKVNFESIKTPGATTLEADKVIVCVGRKPFSDGVGLNKVGIPTNDKGQVIVNDHFQTSVSNIYAIGDLIQGPMLAHKAEEEGVAVAEILNGKHGHVNMKTLPSVIYTHPEVASVGLTEEQLKEKKIPYKASKFPFMANARAKAIGCTEGFVKILAHEQTDELLGVHIFGPRADELLGEAIVAMEFVGSAEDLALSFHAHPTLNEVIREAALGIDKRTRQM